MARNGAENTLGMLKSASGWCFPARLLTVEPGPSAVSPVEEIGHVFRYPLHDGDFVGVQLAVGAQAGRVVDGFGGSRLIQPLLQPVQRDEIVRGTWEGDRAKSTKRNKPVRVSSRRRFVITAISNGTRKN